MIEVNIFNDFLYEMGFVKYDPGKGSSYEWESEILLSLFQHVFDCVLRFWTIKDIDLWLNRSCLYGQIVCMCVLIGGFVWLSGMSLSYYTD